MVATRRLRQVDDKFETRLGNLVRPCLKKGWRCGLVVVCLPRVCRVLG
jgi:hypothetical protein